MDMNAILLMGPMAMNAFWIWFIFGLLLLGVEVFLGTQWLLWAAASAGVVAVICLTGLPFGFFLQALTFAILSVGLGIMTPKFLKVSSHSPDVNDPHRRMVGKQAEVLSGFEPVSGGERTGRVVFDGVEWPAVLGNAGEIALTANDRVVIERIYEGRVFVRPA
jgi:membrane protein implicated in regulation of membrane protease activity